jgi:hypothetical protein
VGAGKHACLAAALLLTFGRAVMSIERCIHRLLITAVLAMPAWVAADVAKEDEEIVRTNMTWMQSIFALPARLELDADVRTAAETMAAAHLARLPEVFKLWVTEERRFQGAATDVGRLAQAVAARTFNHLALWRLQSAGPAFDAAWAALLEQPQLCRPAERASSYFSLLAARWQLAPAEHRHAVLEGERVLLERWAQMPASLLDRPLRSSAQAVTELVRRSRESGARRRVPMAPVVADILLGQQDFERKVGPLPCAVTQWWFREQRAADPAAGEAALLAVRYEWMPAVTAWSETEKSSSGGAKQGEYPPLAARWDVTGTVLVDVAIDATGARTARIAERRIAVAGVRGVRPVAFEALLDEASLQRGEAAQPTTDKRNLRLEFKWSLE